MSVREVGSVRSLLLNVAAAAERLTPVGGDGVWTRERFAPLAFAGAEMPAMTASRRCVAKRSSAKSSGREMIDRAAPLAAAISMRAAVSTETRRRPRWAHRSRTAMSISCPSRGAALLVTTPADHMRR